MHRILLTGAGGPASQNVLRSLRSAPESFHIVGADANRYHLEWGDLDRAYEAPMTDSEDYLPFLLSLIEREGIEFVHGQPDWEVAWLAQNAHHLTARTLLPDAEAVAACQDKAICADAWYDAGLRHDPLRMVRHHNDLNKARQILGLPFWLRATSGAGARGSCKVESLEQGYAWLDFWKARGVNWQFMAQEYLPGPEFAFQSVWYQGRLITSAARERLEFVFPQHAPSGVTSSPVVARSVHNEQVNRIATQAILAVDDEPNGIYCVDLKCDDRDLPRPTEINAGRFFTTSYFFTAAGANMPYLYILLGLGREPIRLPRYDAVPAGLYWIRHIDCGWALCAEGNWRAVPKEKILKESVRISAPAPEFVPIFKESYQPVAAGMG
jgi:carbamoyl-phosphate synthase large subunit